MGFLVSQHLLSPANDEFCVVLLVIGSDPSITETFVESSPYLRI